VTLPNQCRIPDIYLLKENRPYIFCFHNIFSYTKENFKQNRSKTNCYDRFISVFFLSLLFKKKNDKRRYAWHTRMCLKNNFVKNVLEFKTIVAFKNHLNDKTPEYIKK
jgi:hypothetical protein